MEKDDKNNHNLKINPIAFNKTKRQQQLRGDERSYERKILHAKRSHSSQIHSAKEVTTTKVTKGVKRCSSGDLSDKPLEKKFHSDYESRTTSHSSEKKGHSSRRTKNLAEQRMLNLRKILDEKREETQKYVKQKQQIKKNETSDNSILHSTKTSVSKFKSIRSNLESKNSFKNASQQYIKNSSPLYNRLLAEKGTKCKEESSSCTSSKSATVTTNSSKSKFESVSHSSPHKSVTSFSFISNYSSLTKTPEYCTSSEQTNKTNLLEKNIHRDNNNVGSSPNGNCFWNPPDPNVQESLPVDDELANRWKHRTEKHDSFGFNHELPSNSFNKRDTTYAKDDSNDNFDQIEEMDTSMEWMPINEEQIVENINEMRKEMNYDDYVSVHSFSPRKDSSQSTRNGIYIVIDTNVFLSHLSFVASLKDMTIPGLGPIVVVVPWMVIQELDYMKDGRTDSKTLKNGARKAIDLIHECLSNKHPNFRGQTVLEAAQENLSSNNPDDGILFCCLQLAEQQKTVALLSNDKNLRNKVLVNGLYAFNQNEIIKCLKDFHEKNVAPTSYDESVCSITKIKILLSNFFTFIIENEMKKAYGDIWIKMALMTPPFTVEEALVCLDKYWMAVFSFNLQKQCKQCVDEFAAFVKSLRYGDELNMTDYNKYIEFCLRLCVYFKNAYNMYKDQINQVIQGIQLCAK